MIVQCGHCGAPLDVSKRASTTKCRYCGQTNERQQLRTIAEETPKDFAPPKVWTPPPEFAADSSKPLEYKSQGGGGRVLLGLVLVLGAFIGTNFAVRGGLFGTSEDTLAKASLTGTPVQVAKAVSGDAHDTSVWAKLRSSDWERVAFSWDGDKYPDHPTSFYLTSKKQSPDPKVREALSKQLRGGLDGDGGWSWQGLSVRIDPKTGDVTGSVRPDTSPAWRRRLDAAWKVALTAALGRPMAPTADEARELLGAGYPFADLVAIDPTTTVDRAGGLVQARFPGSIQQEGGGVDVYVALDHPLFQEVELRWNNARGAPLEDVSLRGSKSFAAQREGLVACLRPQLGAPEANDADFMKGTRTYWFKLEKLYMIVHESHVAVGHYGHGEPLDGEAWKRIVVALDKCRGS